MTFNVHAVIFDNDGTLVDSTPSIVRAWTRWAHEYGLDASTDLTAYAGVPSEVIVADFVAPERAEEAWRRVDALEVEEAGDVTALDGAAALLASVPASCAAVATSGTRAVATARLKAAGLRVPKVIVTIDDISRGKPDPEIFLHAAELLDQDPADCLVVEDAIHGITAAKAAGCLALGITTTQTREDLVAAGADAVVDSLTQVRVETVDGEIWVFVDEG